MRKILSSGFLLVSCVLGQQYVISTMAGGPPVPAPAAALSVSVGNPTGIATDTSGNVYFSAASAVFKLDSQGLLTRIGGTAGGGYSGDGGEAAQAQLNFPRVFPYYDALDNSELIAGLVTDSADNLYIADVLNNRVRKVSPDGLISTVLPQSAWPQGVAADSADNIYVTEVWGNLRMLTRDGIVTTLAGINCGPGYTGPGLCVPEGIAADLDRNLFIADAYCRIRKLSADGARRLVHRRRRELLAEWILWLLR